MGVPCHGCGEVITPVEYCVGFGHGTSRTKQVTGERGHWNHKEVMFAKLCGKYDVSGSVYAKKKGKN